MANVNNNNNNAAPAPAPSPSPSLTPSPSQSQAPAPAPAPAPDSTSQVEGGDGAINEPPPPPSPSSPSFHVGNKVFKSGPLFLSSKGIGWTSWKKRWFILTQTSLVFYRSDPNVAPQKPGEVNLTLGGIDLNSSGSVVVKEDKKLITVLFSDGRDGRAFTLKAETMEDLQEWKTALEEALLNAPNAALIGQNGLLRSDSSNGADASSEVKDRQTPKSLVIGRPVLLALEDIDGTPSFLEKALRFIEEHGVTTEGILRQAADVELVERRIQEYEKGKTEFPPEEDPHVIADCVKYVLRELPSSPVPASCCKALLEACQTERNMRVNAVRSAICETFPEPNRVLLQRILIMMQSVASNKAVNRMSISAVAACMAPLLLRPLLAGDCDLDNDSDAAGDGSVQLLRAAAAANHAQAICIFLLEEHDNLFGDHAETHEPYTDSEESGSESEEMTDDEDYDESFDEEDEEEEDEEGVTEGSNSYIEEDSEQEYSSTTSSKAGENKCSKKVSESSGLSSPSQIFSPSPPQSPSNKSDSLEETKIVPGPDGGKTQPESIELDDDLVEAFVSQKAPALSRISGHSVRRPALFGRASARKNLSMESVELPSDEEFEIQKLECIKADLQGQISLEATVNSQLQVSLEKWKHDLHERRLVLEKDVARLDEHLQKELELKTALEAALKKSHTPLSLSSIVDDKMRAELEEIASAEADVAHLKKSADELEFRLHQQREHNSKIRRDITHKLNKSHPKEKKKDGGVLASSRASQSLTCRSKHDFYLDKGEDNKDEHAEGTSKKKKGGYNVEAGMNKLSITMSRKSSSKGIHHEGNNSTTSALSKLTNRLNFLKERRTQIASELETMDKGGRGSSSNLEQRVGSEHRVENMEPKGQSSENHGSTSHNNIPNSGNISEGVDPRGDSRSIPAGDSKVHSKFPPRTQHSR